MADDPANPPQPTPRPSDLGQSVAPSQIAPEPLPRPADLTPAAADQEPKLPEGFTTERTNNIIGKCYKDEFELTLYAGFQPDDDWVDARFVGHAWVSVDDVDEKCKKRGKIVKGYWPKKTFDFTSPREWLRGTPGQVNDDTKEILTDKSKKVNHPQQRHKTWKITCAQAKAALAVIRRYEAHPGMYNPTPFRGGSVCSTFAMEVVHAAGQRVMPTYMPEPVTPLAIYNDIGP